MYVELWQCLPFVGEGEIVSLGKNLKARGNVEKWLSDVELHMVQSLKKIAKAGHTSYAEEERTEWILKQPSQLVLAVSQIYWCNEVEEKLNSSGSKQGLEDFHMASGDPLKYVAAQHRAKNFLQSACPVINNTPLAHHSHCYCV